MNEELFQKACSFADRYCLAELESACVPPTGDVPHWLFTAEDGEPVDALEQAAPSQKEAVAWLEPRGLLRREGSGFVFVEGGGRFSQPPAVAAPVAPSHVRDIEEPGGSAKDDLDAFLCWEGLPSEFCLDQIFMSTEGVPDNPFESEDTRMAFDIWRAGRASVSKADRSSARDIEDAARWQWLFGSDAETT